MNLPGKALKRGVKPAPVPSAPRSGTAPVFRILGLLLLAIGLLCCVALAFSFRLDLIYAGAACLFWSAMMYALAEALARLAAIEEVLRDKD